MGSFSNSHLIEGIIEKRRAVIQFMYEDYFPYILAMVEKNSGTIQDAQDIFQDGLVALYLRCRDRELLLNCSLRSYFYAICKNLWLQRLERKYRMVFQPDLIIHEREERYRLQETLTSEKRLARYRLFWKHLKGLPEDCQKVLMMYMDRIPYKKVAEILGFVDENYAKMKKYHCKKALIRRIRRDPELPNCI